MRNNQKACSLGCTNEPFLISDPKRHKIACLQFALKDKKSSYRSMYIPSKEKVIILKLSLLEGKVHSGSMHLSLNHSVPPLACTK